LTDIDVAVVAALIGRDPAANLASTSKPAAGGRSTSGESDTIAGLVRQCRELAPREAAACRRRICAGYWGKAQACRKES
jgi:hypothetical protein